MAALRVFRRVHTYALVSLLTLTVAGHGVDGFDRATSRELPEGRDERVRRYANTDGTETPGGHAPPGGP